MTITVTPIADLTVVQNAADTVVDLFNNFDDPKTTGLVAQFQLDNTLNDPFLAGSVTNVLLFDQSGVGAPGTVQNFQNYVGDGDYVDSFIHRSVPGTVIQGGGFTFQDSAGFDVVPTDDTIQNEFSHDRSNLRGTIAMAKVGNNPDSATSQWFFNLADNSTNLDNQNGGFTVFGQVLGTADLDIIDAIGNLPVFNASSIAPVFNELPLISNDNSFDGENELVRYSDISVIQQNELSFEVIGNSNPAVVNAMTSANGQLVLDYQQAGHAEIIVRATNLLGETTEDTFSITVNPTLSSNPTSPSPGIMEPPIDVMPGGNMTDDPPSVILPSTPNAPSGSNPPVADPPIADTPTTDAPTNVSAPDTSIADTPVIDEIDSIPLLLAGNSGANTLPGNEEDNAIDGGGGNDRLLGLDGDDQLTGGGGRDRLIGGNGNDALNGGGGKDNLNGGAGNDTLEGGGGKDKLNGGNGKDNLDGGGGNDTLKGGKGKDTLDGGNGSDRLIGGSDKDIFVLNTGKGLDQIRDFTDGKDKFRAIGFSFKDISLTQRGNNALITIGNDDIALVRKTDIAEITAADFVR